MKHWMIGSVAAAALLTACGGGGSDDADTEVAVTETQVGSGEVRLPGLTLRSGDAAEASDALAALSLTDGSPGRIGFGSKTTDGANATFNDVTFIVPDEENGEVPIRAASLELVGLEMTDSGPGFSQMTLSDISVSPPDGEDAEVNVGSIQLTNPSPALAAWVSTLMGSGEPADFPAAEDVSFDGLSLANLVASGEDEDGGGQLNISSIDLRGMGPDKLQAIVLEGMSASARDEDEGMDISFSVDSMRLAGADTSFLAGLQDIDDEDEFAAVMAQFTSQNPLDPGYDTALIENLAFDAGGVSFAMPSVEGTVTRDAQGRAVRNVTKPFQMTLSADPNGPAGSQLAGPLQQLGYDELEFSVAQDVEIDPDTDTVNTSAAGNYFALKDGFRLSGGGQLSGVSDFYGAFTDPEFLEAADSDPTAMLGALSSLTLYDMEIVFEDQSIFEKGLQLAAAMSGEDPESLKGQMQLGVGFLPLMGAQAGIDAEILTELSGALSSFLADPGTLTLKFDPETPVTADTFADPSQITKSSLGFSASAE
ncbi:MAG: hypothetical protein AAF292_15960 [Pseudomonadota bacterium]